MLLTASELQLNRHVRPTCLFFSPSVGLDMRLLRDESAFLKPYYAQRDMFPNLLARVTFYSHYSRDGENWTDTILRVVDGNCNLSPKEVGLEERKALFDLFWTMKALPSGRGLWVGGVPNIPNDAAMNCWQTTLDDTDEWGWVANQLMLGGGVGVNLSKIGSLPKVELGNPTFSAGVFPSHADFDRIKLTLEGTFLVQNHNVSTLVVEDSREGWVQALKLTVKMAMLGNSVHIDMSKVRPMGAVIRTFGGVSSGPAPLAKMLKEIWVIIRGAAGRQLNSVECLDVTNHIGLCIKSGNVRRSALIVSSHKDDIDFRNAKHDERAIFSHRHTSNNSIRFEHLSEFNNFDYKRLVEDNVTFGDPGVKNLWLARKTDPEVMGSNPCGEVFLLDRESCNLAEFFPARLLAQEGTFLGKAKGALALLTRFTFRQRLLEFTDSRAEEVRARKMRLGVGLGGLCDFKWSTLLLDQWYQTVRKTSNDYADELGCNRPVSVTTVKPSGTISLLAGSSPGMHTSHAPYYIRRFRCPVNDPMSLKLLEGQVPCEVDRYDSAGNTYVFSFPMAASIPELTSQNESIADQFERQHKLQEHWADNAVSATISFDKDKQDEMAFYMQQYLPKLKSSSFLCKSHSYVQAPLEAISKEEYYRLSAEINQGMAIGYGGVLGITECDSGACPVK